MADPNFNPSVNPFDNSMTDNSNNGNALNLLNGATENSFMPSIGNFSYDSSSNVNMPFGITSNLDVSAFFSRPGGMYAAPTFASNQSPSLAPRCEVDEAGKADVIEDDEDDSDDDEQSSEEGEIAEKGVAVAINGRELVRERDKFKIITIRNLQNHQDPKAVFPTSAQQHIVEIVDLKTDGSRDYEVFFDSRKAQREAFEKAARYHSTLAASGRTSIHKPLQTGSGTSATHVNRKAKRAVQRQQTSLSSTPQPDSAARASQAPSKTASEEKADDLRSKLLAMKNSTLRPAVVMPPKPITNIAMKYNTIRERTLPQEVDRVLEDGRAAAATAAARQDHGPVPVVRPPVQIQSHLPLPFPTLPKGREDELIMKSDMSTNGACLMPLTDASRVMTAADESSQYSKIRALSERLNTPFKACRAVECRDRTPSRTRPKMRQNSLPRQPQPAANSDEHSPKQSSNIEMKSRYHNTTASPAKPEHHSSTARQSSQHLASDDQEDDEVRADPPQSPKSPAVVRPTIEPQSDYYEDLETWLELTGYHDVEYRNRVVARQLKKQELQAQLEELEREAQSERVYTPTVASIQPDVKIPVKTLMAPPPLPFSKSSTISGVTTKTVSSVEPIEDSSTTPNSRKRPQSERADSAVNFRTSKIQKIGDKRPVSRGRDNRQVPKLFDTSLSSPKDEPLEQRISFSHDRQRSFGRNDHLHDNRESYHGGDKYTPRAPRPNGRGGAKKGRGGGYSR
jgi:hypothetical protein